MTYAVPVPAALRRLWPRTFRQKLLAGMALPLGIGMALFAARVASLQRRDLVRQSEDRARVLAQALAVSDLAQVLESDVQGLDEVLRSVAQYPDLRYAMVVSPEGRVLAHTDRTRVGQFLSDPASRAWLRRPPAPVILARTDQLVDAAAPMLVQDRLVGWVRVGLGQEALAANLRTIHRDGALFTAMALLLGVGLSVLASRRLSLGLDRLVALARETGAASQGPEAPTDELAELGRAFDRLTQELDQHVRDLRDREAFLQDLMAHLPVAVLVHAPDGTLQYGNPAARMLFSVEPEQLRGRSLEDVTGPLLGEDGRPLPESRHPLARVVQEHRPARREVVGFRRSSREPIRWLLFEAFPQRESEGGGGRILSAMIEVTEREEARNRLQKALAELEDLYQNAPCGYHTLDPEGTILRINETELRWLGYTREELVGLKAFQDLLAPRSQATFRNHFPEFKRRGWIHDMELDLVRKDGTTMTVLANASAIVGADGSFLYSRSSLTDVTERMKAERALRASQASLAEAQRIAHLGNWELDHTTGLLSWSDETFRIFEREPEAGGPTYEGFLALVHPEDRETVDRAYRESLETHAAYDLVHRIQLADGRVKHVREQCETRYGPEGRPTRSLGTVLDITEQEAAQQERRRLEFELQHFQRLESLGNLAGGVAHDMNNILSVILNLAELHAERHAGEGPDAHAFDLIRKACVRGADLVRRLTQFARKQMEEAEPLDLNGLVREQVEVLERTTLKKATWELDLEAGLPLIAGQSSALGSAIINLCINALDAMPLGGRITLRTRRLPDGGAQVTVEDTGSGMPPEVLARALDPFFTTKPVGKGTGLGLPMVYGAMKAHGGTLEIQSEVGRGTRVHLRFPPAAAPSHLPDGGEAATTPLPPARVLLVDDDDLVRLAVPPLLESLGMQAEAVEGGPQALERLATGAPVDLVILDQNMPRMSGSETLARLRARWPDLPVLLASGYRETDPAVFARVGILEKPYTLQALRAALARLLAPEGPRSAPESGGGAP